MSQPKKFGTFAGVFTPSILTILGVIMYLRMGWVVGNAGLWGTISIIIVAHLISVSTGLSISSIATDKKVGAGGVYYVLSRSLGLPIGGALGMTLFVATALSIALYMVGFAEIFNQVLGYGFEMNEAGEMVKSENFINSVRVTGSLGLLALTIIAFISTSIAIKTQFIIFALILLSLFSIFFGDGGQVTPLAEGIVAGEPASWAVVFAIFFPAVTGFTAGVAMSGDLKDPKKSIPFGTMLAIGAGLIIYMSLAIFTYYSVDAQILMTNGNVYFQMALWMPLVLLGVWGATLSSALGGILGGPRILQAMSADKITPKLFAKGVGKDNEPRNALILTVIIAECGILIGDLNVIAEVVSMFYLAAYGFINLSFFLESWASSDFNPTFKVKKWVGLIGFVATFVVMFKLNMTAMFAAFAIIGGIYIFLSRRQVALGTGDIWQSVWSTIVKKGLKRMEAAGSDHKRNWKPNILLFSGDNAYRTKMIEFSKAVSGTAGIITNFDLIENEQATVLFPKSKETVEDEELEKYGIFGRRLEVQNVFKGIESIACTFGFSGIEPNTVLMAWPGETKDPIWFAEMTQKLMDLDYNVLYLDYDPRFGFRKKEKIDLWWRGVSNNSELMLSLAKFVLSSPDWSQANVRIILVNDTNVDYKVIENRIQYVLEQFRIQAEIKIVNNEVDKKPIYELMKIHSSEADLVFVGIPDVPEKDRKEFIKTTNNLVKTIGTTLLVKASSQFDETDLKIEQISLKHETRSLEQTELIGLNTARDEGFNLALSELDEKLNEITQEMINRSVQGAENYHHAIFSKVTDKMDVFLDSISAAETHEFIHEELDKTLNEVKSIYQDALENQLPLVFAEFNKEANIYLDNKEDLIAYLPQKVQVTSVKDADGNLVPAKRKIRFRSMIQRVWLSQGISEARDQFTEFGYQNLILLHRSKNILHSVVWELLGSINDNNGLDECIKRCKTRLDDALKEIDDEALHLASNFYRNIRNTERDNLNELSEIILDRKYIREVQTKFPLKTNTAIQKVRKNLMEYPQYWYRNLILFTYHLEADIYLIKYSARLQELTDFINNYTSVNYLEPIHANGYELRDQINALKELAEKQDKEGICATNVRPVEEIFFNADFVVNHLIESVGKNLQFLPDEIELMTAASVNNIRDEQGKDIKTEKIDLKDITEYMAKINFVDPVHEKIQIFYDQLKRGVGKLINATLLMQGGIDTYSGSLKIDAFKKVIAQVSKEVDEGMSLVETAKEAFEIELRDRREQLKKELDINQIIEQVDNLTQYVKQHKRRNALVETYKKVGKTAGSKINAVINYFAQKQQDISAIEYKQKYHNVLSEQGLIADFMDLISVKAELPFYYEQLFVGTHFSESKITENRKIEIARIQSGIERIQDGNPGAILILGAAGSGKSYLTGHVANQMLDGKVFQIQPPINSRRSKEDLTKAFQRATGIKDTLAKILTRIPAGSVLVFQDLEQWWIKAGEGEDTLNELSKMISRYGARHYFVMNANIHAYNIFSMQTDIQNSVIRSVILAPLTSTQIREVIWSRHQSGGLRIAISGANERHLTINKINKYLTKYYTSSNGVIGLALQQWVASISACKDNILTMETPRFWEFPVLTKSEWKNIIFQLFIHSNLTNAELVRIYGEEQKHQVERTLNALVGSGLVHLTDKDSYSIKKEARPYVENWLNELGFIK